MQTKTTLKNGLIIANFSSNHEKFNKGSNVAFTFDDGSTLENVPLDKSKRLSLQVLDKKEKSICGRFFEIKKVFELTDVILSELKNLEREVDIIIVPFPMLQALKDIGMLGKCYTASIDRQTGLCSSIEFCTL